MFYRIFIAHPKTVDESFVQHMVFALRFSGTLFAAAFAALIHAVVPCLFEKTASKLVASLYERTHNRSR